MYTKSYTSFYMQPPWYEMRRHSGAAIVGRPGLPWPWSGPACCALAPHGRRSTSLSRPRLVVDGGALCCPYEATRRADAHPGAPRAARRHAGSLPRASKSGRQWASHLLVSGWGWRTRPRAAKIEHGHRAAGRPS